MSDLRTHRERHGEHERCEAYVEPETETIREQAYASGKS
jgi:hypothetical protein